MREDISRRTLLRNGGIGLVAMSTAGLAGCTSSLPVVGDDSASGPAVDRWLVDLSFSDLFDESELTDEYDDGELEGYDRTGFEFDTVVPQAVFDNEEELVVYWPLEQGSELRSTAGVTATDLDWQLTQHVEWEYDVTYTQETWDGTQSYEDERSASIDIGTLAGTFDPADVEDSLEDWADDQSAEDEDLSSEGEYEGFDLYAFEGSAFGVSESYVVRVAGSQSLDSVEALEAAIDVQTTSVGGLSETDDGDALLAQFESAHFASGELHEPRTVESKIERQYGDIDDIPDRQRDDLEEHFEDRLDDWELGLVGSASAYEFDGDMTDVHEVYLYETESDADAGELRDHVESNRDITDQWATIEDLSIDDEGRTLVLSGRVRTRALL
ncbi:Rossmann-fold NAD(P)-binding domain-containing protein [Natronorubrum tibetense]|uniref:Lipoprotein n=1 Tax=Natronorubrum tibetense GA33 TaxID=1114856 RepID=L9WB77_9EURY|nr:hypothetical protein [Natronorubrum tibetense]ELY45548.1 hypothetical protein C496_03968 [Natronorubrum tibetense GA33]